MPKHLTLTFLTLVASCAFGAEEAFTILAPSRDSSTLITVSALVKGDKVELKKELQLPLKFPPTTIAASAIRPLFYVTGNQVIEGQPAAAVIDFSKSLTVKSEVSMTNFDVAHGYAYLSLDRKENFLLGANYREGFVDVYELDESGLPAALVSTLNEGRKNAHCILPSPDNQFVYIPYVKDTNALFQYKFDPETGALSPLEKLDAGPPEGTGPRHMAYHPTKPYVYFSNEQHVGVSVYKKGSDGQLVNVQVCDTTGIELPEDGRSASDIVITPDGKYLFTGLRAARHGLDQVSRWAVQKDGLVKHLGLTKADEVPWGMAISPGGEYLVVTGFGSGTLMVFRIEADGDLTRVATMDWDPKISDVITWAPESG